MGQHYGRAHKIALSLTQPHCFLSTGEHSRRSHLQPPCVPWLAALVHSHPMYWHSPPFSPPSPPFKHPLLTPRPPLTYHNHITTISHPGEDGVIRHFDCRESSYGNRPLALVSSHIIEGSRRARGRGRDTGPPVSLNSVAYNPARPWQFCVGGDDECVRVLDERALGGSGAGPSGRDALQPGVSGGWVVWWWDGLQHGVRV